MKKTDKPKKEKIKKYYFRKFIREIKRVRWSSNRKNWISFIQIILFSFIFTLVIIGFATLVTLLWNRIGIK